MKNADGIPFSYILDVFAHGEDVEETSFYFDGESRGDRHYLGYAPNGPLPDAPYWAGYCDLPDGFECATAEALFDAPYYGGKSLKARWREVHLYEIGLTPADVFIALHADDYPLESYD